jgi:uncharacterized protein (DUF1697 family)
MPRYVALLRGVNVGGKNKLPMADLRALLESLGHTDVATLIQSGNVVFTAKKAVKPESLEKAIAKQFGIAPVVALRTPRELEKVVHSNPFARADLAKVHVGFMASKPTAASVKKLDAERFLPEEFAFRDRELYLFLPNGMGRTKLPAYLDRQLKIPTTVRNWNTVTKLLNLATAT